MFCFVLSFISSIHIGEEIDYPVTRGQNGLQMWGRSASVASNPAQVTFLFPLVLQSLLGLRMKASEAQCDQPSCLCPFLTYQRKNSSRKNSSQMVRKSSEPEGRPTTPPNLPKSLILVRCEKLKTFIPEEPCPGPQGEMTEPEVKRWGLARAWHLWLSFSSSCISLLGRPSRVISHQFPWAEVLQLKDCDFASSC